LTGFNGRIFLAERWSKKKKKKKKKEEKEETIDWNEQIKGGK
jgi:hypothetical protein